MGPVYKTPQPGASYSPTGNNKQGEWDYNKEAEEDENADNETKR